MRRALVWLLGASGIACFGESSPADESAAATDDTGGESGSTSTVTSTSVGSTVGSGDVDTGTGTTVATTRGEGPGECGPATQCVPLPPQGWLGPVVIASGPPRGSAVPCPPDYPDEVLFAIDGLDPGGLQCPCNCGPSVGTCTATGTAYAANNCAGANAGPVDLPPGNCVTLNGSPASAFVQATTNTGSCPPIAGPPEIPMATWSGTATVCGSSADLEMCDQGLCAPLVGEPFAPKVCVIKMGAGLECPGGGWVDGRDLLADWEDGRTCSECTCSDPEGASCNGGLSAYSGNGCVLEDGPHPSGTCIPLTIGVENKLRYDPAALGSCTPQVEVVGEVVLVDPWTICCLP